MRRFRASMGGTAIAALVACGTLVATGSVAQENTPSSSVEKIEQIVVTAQKRSERAQDVAITLNAISADQLRNGAATRSEDVVQYLTNVIVADQASGEMPSFVIRGISSGASQYSNTAAPVGVNVDGVYMTSGALAGFALFDLQRVEVLKGPQGTLFGKNTTGGVVNYISQAPTSKAGGYVEASMQRFNEWRTEAAYNLPLGEAVQVRGSVLNINGDGPLTNRSTGLNTGGPDVLAGRLQVSADLAENWNLLVKAQAGRDRSMPRQYHQAGLVGTGCSDVKKGDLPSITCVDDLGYSDTVRNPSSGEWSLDRRKDNASHGGLIQLNGSAGSLNFAALLSYDRLSRLMHEDQDGSPIQSVDLTWDESLQQSSQEFRVSSGGQGKTYWLAGVYFSQNELNMRRDVPNFVQAFDIRYQSKTKGRSEAVFGSVEVPVTDQLTADAGLRFTRDQTEMETNDGFYQSGTDTPIRINCTTATCPADAHWADPSGRLGLRYKPGKDQLLYLTYNRGFKSGGFPAGITVRPATFRRYDPEYVNAYELGLKTLSLDGTLLFNASTFYYQYKNKQEYTLIPGVDPGSVLQIFSNAAGGELYGAELEARYRVKNLELTAGAGYLHTRFTNYVLPPELAAGVDLTGNEFPEAPHFSYNASVAYTIKSQSMGTFVPRLSLRGQSSMWWTPQNRNVEAEKAYHALDLRLDWRAPSGALSAGVYLLNATDTKYRTNLGVSPVSSVLFNYAPPRTWGMMARYDFK